MANTIGINKKANVKQASEADLFPVNPSMQSQLNEIFAAASEGFQGFVKSDLIEVPNTVITNRAKIRDAQNDLTTVMGIDRIQTTRLEHAVNEMGPSNAPVWRVVDDNRDLVRFYGAAWTSLRDAYGDRIYCGSVDSYAEITFWGTGLNILMLLDQDHDVRPTIDGGSEGSTIGITNFDGVLAGSGRKYSSNQIFSVASGLSLGQHTIKLRFVGGNCSVFGFEILNESGMLQVSAGTGYAKLQEYIHSAQQGVSHNTTFDSIMKDGASSGSLGTKGARVLAYLKDDGSIGKSATAADTTQLNLSSADHGNEEVMRVFNWREFGTDATQSDFATPYKSSGAANYAFTLDDGTTSLVGYQVSVSSALPTNSDALCTDALNSHLTITFVGTGLDIVQGPSTGASPTDTEEVFVDGTSVGNLPLHPSGSNTDANYRRVVSVVSGLPFGTHTIRFERTAYSAGAGSFIDFIVYGPKKPELPVGVVELADFCLMADYNSSNQSGTSTVSGLILPTGTMFKHGSREFLYSSPVSVFANNFQNAGTIQNYNPGGGFATCSDNTNFVQYEFVGTGFVLHLVSNGNSGDIRVQIDGSNNASGVALNANASNAGGGLYTISGALYEPSRVEFTGLSYGKHRVRVIADTLNSQDMNLAAISVITPIYALREKNDSQVSMDALIGSQGILDTRKFSPSLESNQVRSKFAAIMGSVSGGFTTTATFPIPVPDMKVLFRSSGKGIKISFVAECYASVSNNGADFYIAIDGRLVGTGMNQTTATGGATAGTVRNEWATELSPGVHLIQVYWVKTGGSGNMALSTNRRVLIVEEI